MFRRLIQTVFVALITTLSTTAWADLNIAATTPDLAAIASEVGGQFTRVTAMSAPSQDPHYVDPRPSLTLALNKADMLVVNGLELEVGWLPPLVKNARNPKIQTGSAGYFDASRAVNLRDVHTHKVDRSKGDIHPGGNPHYTHDPRAAAAIALKLGEQMAALDSEHADAYRANAQRFSIAMERVAKQWSAKFGELKSGKRQVVAYHGSLVYLFAWLGLEEVITVEPRPGIAPNPAHVAKVLKTMRAKGAKVIVQESYYPQKTSDTLARMAKGQVVVLPGGTKFQSGERYEDRVKRTAEVLYDALSK